MGVVHVIARTVGQDGVHQVGLYLGSYLGLSDEPSGIPRWRLVLEVPLDAPRQGRDIRVYES